MKRIFIILVTLLLLALIAFCVYVALKKPSNDRTWDPSFSKLNTIDFNSDGSLLIHNVRNFTYSEAGVETHEWNDTVVHPEDIESVSFFLDLFAPATPQVGHTFVSFRFKDGSTLAFSIEARREATEKYSFIGGFIRDFELQYLWGTERDLISQRVVYKNEQLYRFPLTVTSAQAAGLLTEFAKETNTLAATPRWYNTLTANCTNLLAKIINKYHPGTLPYDISWNLTGLSDGYLEHQGFIETNGATQAALRTKYDLTVHRSEISEQATSTPIEFSNYIRSLVAK